MAALCKRAPLDDQVALTTFRGSLPSNDTSRQGRLYDVRRAAPCLQMTLHVQVAFTTFGGPLLAFK